MRTRKETKLLYKKEFAELKNQIAYISDNTQFNDQNLLKDDSTITIQTMDSSSASQQVGVELSSVSLGALSLSDVVIGKRTFKRASLTEASDAASARATISAIDAALAKVAGNRATLGATLNRLDFNVESLNNQATNMAATASQIEDADMAKEMSEMTKFKILNEAGISMLSQANQTPQMVSKLLQ